MSFNFTLSDPSNPVVFLDIQVGNRPLGRLVFELYANTTPKTAENFRSLCTGERGISVQSNKSLSYKMCKFHRLISGFMVQGGDITRGDGTGGESIYGEKFPDENFLRTHDTPGLLSMANSGPNTNGSQFFITFRDTPHLNNRHVVFGKLRDGMEVLQVMENVSTDANDCPRAEVIISNCGQLGQALFLTEDNSNVLEGTNELNSTKEEDDFAQGRATVLNEDEESNNYPTKELIEEQMVGMTPAQQRLFKLHLKINQGRKLNQMETEKEYKRINDPSFARRERVLERHHRQEGYSHQNTEPSMDRTSQMTAADCEQLQIVKAAKNRNRASFGWEAFTKEAGYRAYSKRLAKLPEGADSSSSSDNSNPLNYGKAGTKVSENGLNRMVNELNRQQESRLKYSRRRAAHDATTVDHISDKNEHFNKKLKRTFDKYTVEIRQNLERGTAL